MADRETKPTRTRFDSPHPTGDAARSGGASVGQPASFGQTGTDPDSQTQPQTGTHSGQDPQTGTYPDHLSYQTGTYPDRQVETGTHQTGTHQTGTHQTGTRGELDPASPATNGITGRAAEVAIAPSVGEASGTRQLQLHAAQLAERLRSRQRELDSREANLNAQNAHLDNEIRIARLSLQERERSLGLRETAFEERVKTEVARQRQALRREFEQKHAQRRGELEGWARTLQRRQRELEEAERLWQMEAADAAQAASAAESEEKRRRSKLETEQAALAEDRQTFHEQTKLARLKLEDQRQRLVDREQALQRFRDETFRLHRESLEHRLAGEQLWQELSEKLPRAARTCELSRIRKRLADHFKLERNELERQREDLRTLSAKLDMRAAEIRRDRDEARAWLAEREAEIEKQAQTLFHRETEMEAEMAGSLAREKDWSRERRELLAHLRGTVMRSEDGAPSSA